MIRNLFKKAEVQEDSTVNIFENDQESEIRMKSLLDTYVDDVKTKRINIDERLSAIEESLMKKRKTSSNELSEVRVRPAGRGLTVLYKKDDEEKCAKFLDFIDHFPEYKYSQQNLCILKRKYQHHKNKDSVFAKRLYKILILQEH